VVIALFPLVRGDGAVEQPLDTDQVAFQVFGVRDVLKGSVAQLVRAIADDIAQGRD